MFKTETRPRFSKKTLETVSRPRRSRPILHPWVILLLVLVRLLERLIFYRCPIWLAHCTVTSQSLLFHSPVASRPVSRSVTQRCMKRFTHQTHRCKNHRRSQDFLWGVTFFLTKNLMTFLIITLSYMVICVISCHRLPFLSHMREHLTKFSPIFASFQQKCVENFFSSPWRCTCTPCTPGKTSLQWAWFCFKMTADTDVVSDEMLSGRFASVGIHVVQEKGNFRKRMSIGALCAECS